MKMAPSLVRLYEQMPESKYVIAVGACSITGGMFNTDSYSTVRGVDKLIHVDKRNRCFTTSRHKLYVRCSTHTGTYEQELLYQSPSTLDISSETLFKSKSPVSSYKLVN
uniref:NADH:ubiquinone oxidoreductase-like 20kDa subunit domain-containing protein n=1 Tax=Setaria viridis TaxID=4556 RepID=A0A4U6WB41_SETVI|nr:hypothetical protein SEVIR_1G163900v2 [Setaria viridis]